MHPIYEYIVTILVISLVLSFSFYTINVTTKSQLLLAKEEQLNTIANNLFNKIFFSPGYPVDWGSNIYVNESNLRGFGLAAVSREPYTLDIDKLLRLYEASGNTTNPLYMPPSAVGRVLGIYSDGYWKYGFSIKIVTALNITITPDDPSATPPSKFYIRVSDYEGRPATNAYVRGVLFAVYTTGGGQGNVNFDIVRASAYNITDITGSTILNFDVSGMPTQRAAYLVIVNARYFGLQSQAMYTRGNVLSLVIVGNYIIVNMSGIEDIIPSARHLRVAAVEFTSDLRIILNPLINVTGSESGRIINKGRYNYRVYQLSNPISDDVIFVGLLVVTRGQYFMVFAERPRTPLSLTYSTHGFMYAGVRSVVLNGLFRVGENTYYVEFTMWRMSE